MLLPSVSRHLVGADAVGRAGEQPGDLQRRACGAQPTVCLRRLHSRSPPTEGSAPPRRYISAARRSSPTRAARSGRGAGRGTRAARAAASRRRGRPRRVGAWTQAHSASGSSAVITAWRSQASRCSRSRTTPGRLGARAAAGRGRPRPPRARRRAREQALDAAHVGLDVAGEAVAVGVDPRAEQLAQPRDLDAHAGRRCRRRRAGRRTAPRRSSRPGARTAARGSRPAAGAARSGGRRSRAARGRGRGSRA